MKNKKKTKSWLKSFYKRISYSELCELIYGQAITLTDALNLISEREAEIVNLNRRIAELEQDLVHADEKVFFREQNVILHEEKIKSEGRKETAKEIYDLLTGEFECYIPTDIAKEIAERFGVEVEE